MSSPSKEKKRRIDPETSDVTEKAPPPKYGSKNYWEGRYKKTLAIWTGAGAKDAEDDSPAAVDVVDDDDVLPLHEWYFSYAELRPLLLPLILGGRDEVTKAIVDGGSEEDEAENVNPGNSGVRSNPPSEPCHLPLHEKAEGDTAEETTRAEHLNSSQEIPGEQNVGESQLTYNRETDSEGEQFEEVLDSDQEEDVMSEREGLAKEGAICVLEVGCGDVPLGRDLAIELQKLEVTTGAKADQIVKKVVCCDYSETVIEMLKSPRHSDDVGKQRKQTGSEQGSADTPQVVYAVADARKLPYSDAEFHLVLEKGTLDAMLSDKEVGVSNCVSIVTECARVLTNGGYIVIVSHLNAHTTNGQGWLDEVVVPGLRAGGGTARWEIEVHGNDGIEGATESEGGGDNQGEPEGVPPLGNPGPAVYIIKKKPPEEKQDRSSNTEIPPPIPLKFYGY